MMTKDDYERTTTGQLKLCAIALFADGFSNVQIAKALGIDKVRAQALMEAGAAEQRESTMGHMKSCPSGKNRIVSRRDDEGRVANTVEQR